MNYVSVDTAQTETIRGTWTIIHPELIPGSIVSLYKRSYGSADWILESKFADKILQFTDIGNATNSEVYEYYVTLSDSCGEEHRISPLHSTIQVAVEADSVNDIIDLSWNHYTGWEDNVDRYEVWRKLENHSPYKLMSVLPGSENRFSAPIAGGWFQASVCSPCAGISGRK